MKPKIYLFLSCLVWSFFVSAQPKIQAQLTNYNVVWDSSSKNASESMPLLGGDIGCNVWVENGEVLLYVQRSGSLSENGEYLKMGRIRLNLSPNPFENSTSFKQELKLKDGFVEIVAENNNIDLKATIQLWIESDNPLVHIDIKANKEILVDAYYENWRTEDKELLPKKDGSRERFTCFSLEGYPGKVLRVKDEIQHLNNGVLFYHRNPKEKLIPEFLIKQQNLEEFANEIEDDIKNRTFGGYMYGNGFVADGTTEGKYQITPFKAWHLKSTSAAKKHKLIIATHIEQAESLDDWKNNLFETIDEARKQLNAFENSKIWWNQFWQRSFIFIYPENGQSDDPVWQMSRNYQLFRYQLGGNVHGEYPTKFNGGNLIYDPVLVNKQAKYEPDWRQWGGAVHTAQNQRLLYWPMLKSGDYDAILPQFELYRKGLPGATARVKKHFGHEGAVFSEYMSVPGIVFGAGWGWEGNGHRARGEEIPFGDERATGSHGYNEIAEAGVMANQSCAYHWESQVEHAYMVLEYHRFSGNDISAYIPFIKSSLIFFDQHYQLRQKMRNGKTVDENGKLVIYPSTSCESYRGAKNPSDLLAGLKACIKSILELNESYVSATEKEYYKGFLSRIPDFPFAEVDNQKVLKPAYEWMKEANQELPQFYPLFPFNQFKLGDEEIEVFKNTYTLAPEFRKGTIKSWHQDGIQFARMGMTEEAADYNTRKLQDSPRRYPTFWGPGHDWVPDHNWGGSGMLGLQEMLMQTIGDQIVLLPAWPKNWDVDFKLHAPKQTTVEVQVRKGKIISKKVLPEWREKDVVVMNDF